MEDIQDGIKVSIQDGVEEDPTLIGKLDPKGKTSFGISYILTEIPNPQITTIFDTHEAIGCPSCPIISILETAVT